MNLLPYYRKLLRRFGPQRWWPAETPFEVMVGAILTQNTNWSNVEKAIANLKSRDLLHPRRLLAVEPSILVQLIRPAGYFNVKTDRLRTYVAWFLERYGGSVKRMTAQPMERLRSELLDIKGIGQETADSILLYALDMPIFVVDAYTHRIFSRHHLVPEESTYEETQEFATANLPADRKVYNEFHALIVRTGKDLCRKKPKCDRCPLKPLLPPGGLAEREAGNE